jgi:glycosidase
MSSRGLSTTRLRVVGFVLVALGAVSSAINVARAPGRHGAVDMSTLTLVVLLEAVSWAAVPLFAWLLRQGFAGTTNRGRYALRLAVLAVLSEVPYDLATSGRVWDLASQNPVFALLVGFVVMWALDHLLTGPRRRVGIAALVCVAGVLWLVIFNVGLRLDIVPMGVVLLLFCLIFYFLGSRENTMMMAGGVLGALALIFPAVGMLLLHFRRSEEPAPVADSRRYLLYGFYPVGLLAAGLVAALVSPGTPAAVAAAPAAPAARAAIPASSDAYRNYYEIFVGSFYDSNGDGVGDLAGVTDKLSYIRDDLGADGIWLTPISPSPSYHKYDITDFEAVDPSFGTMADFEKLIAAAHAKGIRVLLDLVVQHTSSQHPWFQQAVAALQAGTPSPYIDYYHFARTPQPGYVQYGSSNIYYSAAFSPDMPDLNLDAPAVRTEIASIVTFWLGKGADGFRLDATTSYYPHDEAAAVAFIDWLTTTSRAVDPDAYVVGEAWTDASTLTSYYASGADFFNYPFALVDGTINADIRSKNGTALAAATQTWNDTIHAANPDAMNAAFISNHDNPRPAGYLLRKLPAEKLSAATYLLMPGSPFLYYGEEIGMLGSGTDPNKRMPMVWSAKGGTGTTKPPPGGTYDESAVVPVAEQLRDPNSLLSFYHEVLALKAKYPGIARGAYTALRASDASVMAFSDAYQGTTVYVLENLDTKPHTEDLAAVGVPSGAKLADYLLTGGSTKPSLAGDRLTLPAGAIAVISAH